MNLTNAANLKGAPYIASTNSIARLKPVLSTNPAGFVALANAHESVGLAVIQPAIS